MADFARYVWLYLFPSKRLKSKTETNRLITEKTIPQSNLEQTVEEPIVSSVNEPQILSETIKPIIETTVINLAYKTLVIAPNEFLRRFYTSLRDLETLTKLEEELIKKTEVNANESLKLNEALEVYAGKRILFVGVRKKYQ